MTSYERGAVVLVAFPDSNHITTKRRPALVVQATGLRTDLAQVILAMISSNVRRAGYPSRVIVDISSVAGQRMGLISDSVILLDNLATAHLKIIDKQIGYCPDMTAIDTALRRTLSL